MSTDGNVNYHYVCFQNASCSGHKSSSFNEVSVLRCVISVWSDPSNTRVVFTDGLSEEHQSRSALLRHDAGLLQAQRDWSESSEDGQQSPDGCENLQPMIGHYNIYITARRHQILRSLTQNCSIEKEPLLKAFTAKLLKLCIMFDFWVHFLRCGSNWS